MTDNFVLSEVVRKLANLIRIGKIVEIDGFNVKVQIGRVTTDFLPIISCAGENSIWLPISKGEQVVVFAPYGEFTQGFVLRSIHYNSYPVPGEQNTIAVQAKDDVKVEGSGKCEVVFQDALKSKLATLF